MRPDVWALKGLFAVLWDPFDCDCQTGPSPSFALCWSPPRISTPATPTTNELRFLLLSLYEFCFPSTQTPFSFFLFPFYSHKSSKDRGHTSLPVNECSFFISFSFSRQTLFISYSSLLAVSFVYHALEGKKNPRQSFRNSGGDGHYSSWTELNSRLSTATTDRLPSFTRRHAKKHTNREPWTAACISPASLSIDRDRVV